VPGGDGGHLRVTHGRFPKGRQDHLIFGEERDACAIHETNSAPKRSNVRAASPRIGPSLPLVRTSGDLLIGMTLSSRLSSHLGLESSSGGRRLWTPPRSSPIPEQRRERTKAPRSLDHHETAGHTFGGWGPVAFESNTLTSS
jgi:hypothetical protein